jgi:hypothetical protein
VQFQLSLAVKVKLYYISDESSQPDFFVLLSADDNDTRWSMYMIIFVKLNGLFCSAKIVHIQGHRALKTRLEGQLEKCQFLAHFNKYDDVPYL